MAVTVIAIANEKGGAGKTTTVVNLGAALQELGKRVLLVDLDPQASLTVHLGIREPDTLQYNCGHVIRAAAGGSGFPTFREALVRTPAGVDLLPAGRQLVVGEPALYAALGREFIFRDCLAPLRGEYDFILIDCLPTMHVLVSNALTAADAVLVPVQAEYLATRGLEQILQTIETVRARLNPGLQVLGILLTMADMRTTHARQIVATVRDSFQGKIRVFETIVRVNVGLRESSEAGRSVLDYSPKSRGATAFRSLAGEVVAALAEANRAGDSLEGPMPVLVASMPRAGAAATGLAQSRAGTDISLALMESLLPAEARGKVRVAEGNVVATFTIRDGPFLSTMARKYARDFIVGAYATGLPIDGAQIVIMRPDGKIGLSATLGAHVAATLGAVAEADRSGTATGFVTWMREVSRSASHRQGPDRAYLGGPWAN
jgi:chromosome partitioning protein